MDRWDDIVKTAAQIGRSYTPQLQIALELGADAVEPTPPPTHTAPQPECGAATKGEEARPALATELAARLKGKTYDFVLETADETNEPIPRSGHLAPVQRVPAGSVKRTLVSRIETVGRRSPMLKLRADQYGIDTKERPATANLIVLSMICRTIFTRQA